MNLTLLGFLKKEFIQTLRDPVMRVFIFAVPVIQLTIFGYALSTEFKDLKLASIHKADDYIGRQITQRIYGSKWFIVPKISSEDPEEILKLGQADAVLVMPPEGTAKAIERGEGKLQLLIDSQNATKARVIESYLNQILSGFAKEKFSEKLPDPPLIFDIRTLYNPSLKTSIFMVPAIMTMIICIVTIILTAMSLAREKEMGTFESIVSAPLKNIEIILGKTVPFVILGLADAFIVILAGVIIFDVPIRGPVILIAISALVFVCSTVSIGMIISTFAKNQQQAMMGSFMFLFPAILMSGVFYPIENMPSIIKFFAYFDPLKYFISILRNIMIKGANPELVITNLAVLVLMTLVILYISARRFHQTLN
ncbi:ABC transporter permease [Elusimicrobiota bacterium]